MTHSVKSSGVKRINDADICGLWEVIRICKGKKEVRYPWLNDRFMFNFLEEKVFLCLKNRHCHHGTWELSDKVIETRNRFSIILNGIFEYLIIDIDEDEIILSDHLCEYFLVRKL